MHRVVVLALDGVFPFELSMPGRIFDTVPGGAYEVVTCSVDGGPVLTSSDYGITVGHGPEVLATADTVIIPAISVKARWFGAWTLPEPVRAAFAMMPILPRLITRVDFRVLVILGLLFFAGSCLLDLNLGHGPVVHLPPGAK